MTTKTINGMILDVNDSIATHLLTSGLNFYDLYHELESNKGFSIVCDGIETMTLTDNSIVIIDINKGWVL